MQTGGGREREEACEGRREGPAPWTRRALSPGGRRAGPPPRAVPGITREQGAPTILDRYLHSPILLPAPHLPVERVLQTGGASEKHRHNDFSKFHSIQIFEKIAVFDLKTYPWHDILMIVG